MLKDASGLGEQSKDRQQRILGRNGQSANKGWTRESQEKRAIEEEGTSK